MATTSAGEQPSQRVGVVVGTGPAMGRASAVALVGAGYDHVVCLDRDIDAAEASARAVKQEGGASSFYRVDVTDRSAVRDACSDVYSRLGSINGLVNVVGGSHPAWGPTADTTEEAWDWTFQVNVRQQLIVAQEVLRFMRKSPAGGAIVAIASISGLTASTRHGAYGAAKASLISLVRTLAVEHAAEGIRVNAIAPGSIDTPARTVDNGLDRSVPLGRRGTPADIANAVAFLASDKSAYITGQVLVVDGGIGIVHSFHQ